MYEFPAFQFFIARMVIKKGSDAMKFILDTSIFTNPDTQKKFGDNMSNAVISFSDIIKNNDLELFVPVSIYRELSHFMEEKDQALIRKICTVKSPDLYSIQVPAAIFHTFIADLRDRMNKGLRIAEQAIHEQGTADNIKKIRQKFREALRSGIVDSVEDLDVILLAKELGGAVLSADEGIFKLAESLGIEFFTVIDFIHKFQF